MTSGIAIAMLAHGLIAISLLAKYCSRPSYRDGRQFRLAERRRELRVSPARQSEFR
jgi:hypothetical protein